MIPVGMIAGAGLGLYGIAQGAAMRQQALRAQAANVRPAYTEAPQEQQMLNTAESMYGQGMSDAAREAYRQSIDRTLGTGIDAVLRGGGNINNVGTLVGNTQGEVNKMAIYDNEARLQNLERLQGARARYSAVKDKDWQLNKYNPWADKAAAINQQLTAAQNMTNSGFNTFSQGVLGAVQGMGNAKEKYPGYVPQQPGMQHLPSTGFSAMPSQGYLPSTVPVPAYNYSGQPFGMMNENIDNTPYWNGYNFQ